MTKESFTRFVFYGFAVFFLTLSSFLLPLSWKVSPKKPRSLQEKLTLFEPSYCAKMGLVICWFDLIRFGIVGVSFMASLWVLYIQDKPGNHVRCSQLWRSCWKGVHPGWLLATRLVSFLVLAFFLTWDLMDAGVSVFVYYSGITYALLMVYFVIGIGMSAYGCWLSTMQTLVEAEAIIEFFRRVLEETGTTNSINHRIIKQRGLIKLQTHYAENTLNIRAGFWGYLMQAAYQTSAGAVILTDILFWGTIVPLASEEQILLNTVMICMHIFNVVFLLLDTALNSMPFPWFRIAYFVIWGCIYCIFQWVIHACGFTWWPYPFLELGTSWSPYWYLLLVVLHFPCFGIYALIFKAKNTLFSKWCPKSFINPEICIKQAKE